VEFIIGQPVAAAATNLSADELASLLKKYPESVQKAARQSFQLLRLNRTSHRQSPGRPLKRRSLVFPTEEVLISGITAALLVALMPPSTFSAERQLDVSQARLCVTGADHNRPNAFPGLGDFIGWPGGIERMPNGDLLLVHSVGYWHSSFAQPRGIEPTTRKRWSATGWPLDFPAPTGGRTMACRSTDGGRTWPRPLTILDHRLDDGPHAVFTARDGTVLCFN